ncbi:MAG: C40 family peptidase [Nonomuraea sp.]|nr:C40 family peptidase [Nonomuraea sp.]
MSAPPAQEGPARGQTAANAALGVIGTPYSWGGGGPSGATFGTGRGKRTKGFDCSGLTEYAWAQAGIRIGSTSYAQWRSGMRIGRDDVRAGDLAFFETNKKRKGPDHVGIAINDSEMVVAPFTGAVVRIEALDRRHFRGLVRPKPARHGKIMSP